MPFTNFDNYQVRSAITNQSISVTATVTGLTATDNLISVTNAALTGNTAGWANTNLASIKTTLNAINGSVNGTMISPNYVQLISGFTGSHLYPAGTVFGDVILIDLNATLAGKSNIDLLTCEFAVNDTLSATSVTCYVYVGTAPTNPNTGVGFVDGDAYATSYSNAQYFAGVFEWSSNFGISVNTGDTGTFYVRNNSSSTLQAQDCPAKRINFGTGEAWLYLVNVLQAPVTTHSHTPGNPAHTTTTITFNY